MANIKVIAAETHTPEYLLHKYWARKPHNVVSNFISELVPPNGTVVDPFCGSGVVLREAQKLGRTAYGFDINPTACLISQVLVDPPDTSDFIASVTEILSDITDTVMKSYTENNLPVKYCVHEIIARCPKCECIQKQKDATLRGKKLYCKDCGTKLRLNLEYMVATDITSIAYETSRRSVTDATLLCSQKEKSEQLLLDSHVAQHSYEFTENRRILAFNGMTTQHLFTPRNFSILSYLSDAFSAIQDKRIRQAAQLLLSASVAQCSRLIASRNNLTTGGPAWSIPGFWVPAVHLETNPIVHLRARLRKFSRGLEILNKDSSVGKAYVEKIDSRLGLNKLSAKGINSDLVFFDPPYGDNIPYVEFSSMWNSFLGDFPDPNLDISVSDRLPKSIAWDKYCDDLKTSISSIRENLKPDGRLLITFNNNDPRAWRALLSSLQINNMACEFVTYQIPAVVSSKARKAIDNSYISDIYSIYKKADERTVSRSLSSVTEALIACAKFRGGTISKSLAQRTMLIAWLANNICVELIEEMTSIQNSLFEEKEALLVLKGYSSAEISPFISKSQTIASNLLRSGPCEWRTLYEAVSTSVAGYGIPDPHELRAALDGFVTFDGNRCVAYIEQPEQLSLFDLFDQ